MIPRKILQSEVEVILNLEEGHFADLKSKDISPAKITRTISSFANADGGEVYIGIEDSPREWQGFATFEDANGLIQALEGLFPLGNGFDYTFLESESYVGYVLKVETQKSHDICVASDNKAYLRRGAQNLPQTDQPSLERLKRNKGLASFESEVLNTDPDVIVDSEVTERFVANVIPSANPTRWLKKQQLIREGKPSVAGVMLFAEEPQALLPKRSGVKIYRYQTRDESERSFLVYDPITIEGCAYDLIKEAVSETVRQIEGIEIMTSEGLVRAKYPKEALHEIVTNAILHRDYSVPDDVHIRIFDNRVEVQSPGLLPAHITPQNILQERYSRNGTIVRLINKFPNPPNKDVGEGLNTAFEAMATMRLVDPVIRQQGMNVVVTLKHESLASPETLIMQFLECNEFIVNKQAREITNIGSENSMKHILRKMVDAGMIDVVTGKTVFDTKYTGKKV
ncbi:ATP-dependent DNA helicase RecG [Erythrobacter insulae]|uniref:ATP-dependent DNA helicase RecG n=1 Tax=Erythrobacter insulae TaxID=2584124 RepID=A0A547PE00_9SPHN|nr:ATP-binding protein [Erythrobacter insulae]TRD12358.1 ATP-dependent DNA helicase RecG [Erythrobacter insulae]